MSAVRDFLAARDFLLQHRSDYATAYRDFRWPRLEHFNWALDHFDALARGNAQYCSSAQVTLRSCRSIG